jgi:maltose O-acetyltransferase
MSAILRRIYYRLLREMVQKPRVAKYLFLSNNRPRASRARLQQPTLFSGQGEIVLGQCHLGIWPSPFFFSGYQHLEARNPGSRIEIGDGVYINNNAVIIADRTSISIGADTLIGPELCIFDSDFHDLHPERRSSGTPLAEPVTIGKNVFLGSKVTILKGVTIGDNSVIANGSVVTKSIPANVIAGGIPAKVIGAV